MQVVAQPEHHEFTNVANLSVKSFDSVADFTGTHFRSASDYESQLSILNELQPPYQYYCCHYRF